MSGRKLVPVMVPSRRLRKEVEDVPITENDIVIYKNDVENFNIPGTDIKVVNEIKKKAIKKSVFHITVSSNVPAKRVRTDTGDSIGAALQRTSYWLFEKSWRTPRFLDIFDVVTGPRHYSTTTGDFPRAADIHSVQWIGGETEIGDKARGKRIHLGGTLIVYHYTKLRVNQKRCQQYLNYLCTFNKDQNVTPKPPSGERAQSVWIRGVYVNARHEKDWVTDFLYDNKNKIREIMRNL